jgi:hypothetical protein
MLSILLPIYIVSDAQKDQTTTFQMMISLVSNKLNVLIIFNCLCVIIVQFCSMVIWLFFGEIRIIEMQYIIEKSQKKIFYFLLLSIILRNTFDIYKMMCLLMLFMMCILHWLINKRADYILSRGSNETGPHLKILVISKLFTFVCFLISYRFYKEIKIA